MAVLTWVGGHGSNFLDALNWTPQKVPGATSDVMIAPAAGTSINTVDATINSLHDNAQTTFTIAPTSTFTILDKPDAANRTGTSVNAGTIIEKTAADVTFYGTFDNSGLYTSQLNSDLWDFGKLSNTGRMQMSADLHVGTSTTAATVVNAAGARYAIRGPADIRTGGAAGSSFTNDGSLTRSGTGTTDVTVAVINHDNVSVSSGGMSFLGAMTNTGVMSETGAVLMIAKAIRGNGLIDLANGGRVVLGAGADTGQTVDFLNHAGVLALTAADTFHGTIADFAGAAKIDLVKAPATSLSYSGGVLTVANGGAAVAHLDFIGNYNTSNFALSSDGHGGSLVTFV